MEYSWKDWSVMLTRVLVSVLVGMAAIYIGFHLLDYYKIPSPNGAIVGIVAGIIFNFTAIPVFLMPLWNKL